tara:strand:+ start:112 stop:369 length:258 start_codon:yes stop_codon:yes gene_type:complete
MSDNETAPAPEPEPVEEAVPAAAPKKKRVSVKMTDKQKTDLTKHMDKMKKGGMEGKDLKSHRMKMMSRMRKGQSVSKAHKDITAA